MQTDATVSDQTYAYLDEKAPVFFVTLSTAGRIVKANRFARTLTGRPLAGEQFHDVIVDLSGIDLPACGDEFMPERILNVKDASGLPQSFYFTFKRAGDYILGFGRIDTEELATMRNEVLSLNNDLNNLTRELHKKNAGLTRLNNELQEAHDKILELTRTDPLTELANRRHFSERIEEMVLLSQRRSQPLSLIISDIDKFKRVNDTFGHGEGDRILVEFAQLMQRSTRAEDLVARFGGEEFAILLPLTASGQAYSLAERIRKSLADMDLLDDNHAVTASFGISQLNRGEKTADLIKRADTALYRAKQSGRNRTVIAE
jgi:diguanylate cyclase (GGDEF)-like protein